MMLISHLKLAFPKLSSLLNAKLNALFIVLVLSWPHLDRVLQERRFFLFKTSDTTYSEIQEKAALARTAVQGGVGWGLFRTFQEGGGLFRTFRREFLALSFCRIILPSPNSFASHRCKAAVPGGVSYLRPSTVTLLSLLHISVPALLAPERLLHFWQVEEAHSHAFLQAGL